MTKVSMTERMVRKFRFRARISLAVILQVSVSSSTLMEADVETSITSCYLQS